MSQLFTSPVGKFYKNYDQAVASADKFNKTLKGYDLRWMIVAFPTDRGIRYKPCFHLTGTTMQMARAIVDHGFAVIG